MKKVYLLALLTLVSVSVYAQNSVQGVITDTTLTDDGNFDTMIVFRPPQMSSCLLYKDMWSLPNADSVMYFDNTGSKYYNSWQEAIHYPVVDSAGNIISVPNPFLLEGTVLGANNYNSEGFAQRYHFDSVVTVCGIAVIFGGGMYYEDKNGNPAVDLVSHFRMWDTTFHEIATSASCQLLLPAVLHYITDTTHLQGYRFENFANYQVQDFFLSGDEQPYQGYGDSWGSQYSYSSSRSIFDTIWQDTLIGCQNEYNLWFKKDGVWKDMGLDSVYQFYQKKYMEIYPIILHPKRDTADAFAEDAVLEENLYVYPNPAEDWLNVQSGFRVDEYELYSLSGELYDKKKVGENIFKIDISRLKAGTYVLTLKTPRGKTNRQFVKE